jgi:predicted PurR-regulated permease PerM
MTMALELMPDRRTSGRAPSDLIPAAAVILLGYLVFLIVRPFATPLMFAVVMVVMFQPLSVRLERRLTPSVAAALSTLTVILIIIVPAVLVASRIVSETIDLAGNVRSLPFDTILARAQGHATRWGIDLDTVIREGAQRLAGQAGILASRVIHDVWALSVGIVIAILAMFFLFRDGARVLPVAVRALPLPTPVSQSLVRDVGAMIASSIAASLAAASIQGTIGGLTFAWLGLPAPVVWGVVMGVCCAFPLVGAWLVWGPAAVALLIAGRPWDALLLVAIGLAVVHPVDNLLRPAMMAHATKLNGFLVLVGLLGGVQAFGASGLLLGPVLMSVAVTLMKTVTASKAP